MSNKRSAPLVTPLVIELLDSDDDDDDEVITSLNDVRKRLKTTPSPRAVTASTEDDDSDDDGGGKLGPCCPIMQQRSIKKEGSNAIISLLDDSQHPSESSNEVQVLTNVESAMEAVAAFTSTNDEIEVIGCKNQTRLPHMRQHCTENEFVQDVLNFKTSYKRHMAGSQKKVKQGLEKNPSYCDMCFCYVCDVPAKECPKWKSDTGSTSASENHCLASDKGADSYSWKSLRNGKKGTSTAPFYPFSEEEDEDEQDYDSDSSLPYGGLGQLDFLRSILGGRLSPPHPVIGAGPFDPEHATEEEKRRSTKCRKCGWYSRLQEEGDENVGCFDWCHKCGRVCDEAHLNTMSRGHAYEPIDTDCFLGTKTIPFTIHSHDPRKFEQYKQSWTENEGKPGWEYNVQDMDDEMFRHRFGERPLIGMIIASIPILERDKIPETGQIGRKEHKVASANETEYIVLQERSHRAFLEELSCVDMFGKKVKYNNNIWNQDRRTVVGDIRATWNKAERKGTFSIRVFFKQRAFSNKCDGQQLARFLGSWFDVFPYSLVSLTRGLEAKKQVNIMGYYSGDRISAPPFYLGRSAAEELLEKQATAIQTAIEMHNSAAGAFSSGLSFTSSIGRKAYGGVCDSNIEFSSVLNSFFTEIFMDELRRKYRSTDMSFVGKALGIVAHHRTMRRDADVMQCADYDHSTGYRSYLRDEDHALASEMIPTVKTALKSVTSLDGLLHLLENLGHASVPHVDGLTVELLEFQKQTVQWALEREKTPGGLQSFFWTKLPQVQDPKKEIYFNPILGRLSTTRPAIVRGGIIAEQMGLGKTVISLALILQNPAPALPLSGSSVGSIPKSQEWDGVGWNPDTRSWTNGKGKILSRGTLVICHVSLVGQWIEESKSKLSNPGLIYPYHGGNRKRDAEILAKNAIVVTTYATISSDKNYHAKKAGPSYCPPCEQVRWWRIICDESHALKDGTTKQSAAVLDLVADHKWCVSGTPMNTGIKDLKSQFKFVGIERVDELFSRFNNDMFSSDRRDRSSGSMFCRDPAFGPFMFFMRQVMMRHSMRQKYVGTSTQLMSLPPKEERTMTVKFSKNEETEYKRLERDAKHFYEHFKLREGHQLSNHYLVLFQKLTPVRIACSGGAIPEQDEDADSDNGDADGEKEKNKIVVSSMVFKSKLNALVKELERIRDEEPHAKSLIFSQFTSTLKFLQEELPKHGFDFRTLSGDMTMKHRAKALHDFQHDPPTTIFLLSMRAGACGINLTQANRVFILEPAFNPALEAQAIGRVWRMGQKQKVEIIRMITDDTVEVRLREMLDKKYGTAGSSTAAASAEAAAEEEANAGAEPASLPAVAARASASASGPVIVGNIQTDRTMVLTEEFDLLFGLSSDSTPCPYAIMSREEEE